MISPKAEGLSKCLYPIFLTASGILINGLSIGFTSPHNTLVRLGASPLMIAPTYINALHCTEYIPNPFLSGVLLSSYSSNVSRYVSLVLLQKWSFQNDGPLSSPNNEEEVRNKMEKKYAGGASLSSRNNDEKRKKKKRQGGFFQRVKYGLIIANSIRHVGTPYQVKNVPHFSSKDPAYIPSRSRFLFRTASAIATSYLVLILLSLHLSRFLHPPSPSHTFLRRYTHTFFVFFYSGTYHQIQDFGTVVPWHKSHTLRFFVTQALGVLHEDHVQQLFDRYRRGRARIIDDVCGLL